MAFIEETKSSQERSKLSTNDPRDVPTTGPADDDLPIQPDLVVSTQTHTSLPVEQTADQLDAHAPEPELDKTQARAPEILVLRGKETSAPRVGKGNPSPGTRTSLRPSRDIINRIEWDDTCYSKDDIVIGYLDRHDGILEIPFADWKKDATDEEFIPQHRIRYIKQKSGGVILWDRASRIDRIFGSGYSRGEVEALPEALTEDVEVAAEGIEVTGRSTEL